MGRGTAPTLLAALCIAAAGCGGAVSHPAVAEPRFVDPTLFAAEVDDVCKSVSTQLLRISSSSTELTEAIARTLAIEARGLAHLRALTPPAGERATYVRFTAALAARHATRQMLLQRVRARDLRSYRGVMERMNAQAVAATRLAQRMSLRDCPSY